MPRPHLLHIPSDSCRPGARLRQAWGALALLAAGLLASCGDTPPADLPGAASEPAGAVRQLADHLRRNDLVAFARDALPPAEHARLAEAWAQDRSRWPLTELPLEDRLPAVLATLAAPGAERGLRRDFDRQFAGQDTALRDASRSLALFGGQYLTQQGHYSPEERDHYAQVIAALGRWAGEAPLGERKHAHAAIDRLAAAARATGLASEDDLRQAGMVESLRRLGPFLGEAKAVVASYGLDLDASLADLRTGLVEEQGDRAVVRIHYPLGATEIDTTVSLVRRDGHWYMADYLAHAATLLAAPPPVIPPGAPLDVPAPPDPATAAPPPGTPPPASGPAPAR